VLLLLALLGGGMYLDGSRSMSCDEHGGTWINTRWPDGVCVQPGTVVNP
jgi:hypothetical protein